MQNKHQSMRGQWMGKSTGTNTGTVIANFDELQFHYQVTNLDDIESYIKAKESTNGKKYLWAIDMPVRDRKQVIQELNFMGITAGSLFPGLDGACEELKERNFTI